MSVLELALLEFTEKRSLEIADLWEGKCLHRDFTSKVFEHLNISAPHFETLSFSSVDLSW